MGRFDPDSGPVDVDLSKLPEAEYVSRRHAEIWPEPSGDWFVKDLGARNGTWVRGTDASQFVKVTDQVQIADGYLIALGNAQFEFKLTPPA